MHLDACLDWVGAIYGKQIYTTKVPKKFKKFHISILEMLNILLAIRVWSTQWTGCEIRVHCDNAAVVSVLNNGKTKDKDLAAIARNIFMACAKFDRNIFMACAKFDRNIFMACAKFDIHLYVTHIQGTKNTVADLLSRWTGSPAQNAKLKELVPNFEWITINEKKKFILIIVSDSLFLYLYIFRLSLNLVK